MKRIPMKRITALTIRNTQRTIPIAIAPIRQVASRILYIMKLEFYSLDIWITNSITMKKLNEKYRYKKGSTDILSFPFQKLIPPPSNLIPILRPLPPSEIDGSKELGQLIISAPDVKRDAIQLKQNIQFHLRTLIVHGICHLLGYDHETESDAIIMEAEEKRILLELDHIEHEAKRNKIKGSTRLPS